MPALAHEGPTLTLEQLASVIRAAIAAGDAAAKKSIQHYVSAGTRLIEVKEQLPHGKWEAWVEENTGKSPRTCRAYMRLARLSLEDRQRVADLSLREALAAIAEPVNTTVADEPTEVPAERIPYMGPYKKGWAAEEPTPIRSRSRGATAETETASLTEVSERQRARGLATGAQVVVECHAQVDPETATAALKDFGLTSGDLEGLSEWAADMATRLAD